MKNNSLWLMILLWALSSPLSAQTTDTLFFNAQYASCPKNEATFFRTATPSLNNSFLIYDYWKDGRTFQRGLTFKDFKIWNYVKEGKAEIYFRSGILKETITYKNGVFEGLNEQFYMNGRPKKGIDYQIVTKENENKVSEPMLLQAFDSLGKQLVKNGNGKWRESVTFEIGRGVEKINFIEEGIYKKGKKDSTWVGLLNGKTFYKEEFSQGIFKSGVSFDSLGRQYSYQINETFAEFQGGINPLVTFLTDNVEYPALARVNNIQGKVRIKFIIEKNGEISNFNILKNIHPLLDEEALRILNLSRKNWQAGTFKGQPSRCYFILPVSFLLE